MASAEERLMEWLRDAHAMEEQAEQMLSSTAHRLKDYPELRLRIVKHLEETRRQSIAVRGCIERRGGTISFIKDLVGKTTAVAQGLSGLFVSDEVVKALLAIYTFEHMEIASYRILITAADHVGDSETRQVCESIVAEEQAMADWVDGQLVQTARDYLSREQATAA